MKMLIEAGADPDFIDNEGQTPIFYSVRMAKLQSMDFLIGNCDIDIHREDNYGNNIVHVAQKLKIDKVKKAQLIDRLVAEGLQVPNPAAEAKKKVSNIFILLEVLYLKFIKFSWRRELISSRDKKMQRAASRKESIIIKVRKIKVRYS